MLTDSEYWENILTTAELFFIIYPFGEIDF